MAIRDKVIIKKEKRLSKEDVIYKYTGVLSVYAETYITSSAHDKFQRDNEIEDVIKSEIMFHIYGKIRDDLLELEKLIFVDYQNGREINDKFVEIFNKLEGKE